ncbi:MAG: hypothetical protein K8S24_00200 [Candidatus Aegiribacteria sp.]|nr:hypothetical protein [Candidatus Aegiribacteria sp.]
MKNNGRFQNGLFPPALGILFAAGLLPADTAAASDQFSNRTGTVGDKSSNVDLSRSFFTRTSVLWSNPQWQEFKRIWKKLDSISQADVYHNSSQVDYEAIDKIRIELDNSYVELMGISDEIGIDSLEVRLRHGLATDRLTSLFYGSIMPLTRMAPPPVSDQTDYLVPQIEARIDTVVRLREEGLISSEEMVTAFSNLRSHIDTYFLLETINFGTRYSGVLWSVRWPMEADLIRPHFDSIRTAVLDSLQDCGAENEERYNEILAELENMEKSIGYAQDRLPALHDLILDLELF